LVLISVISCLHFCHPISQNSGFALFLLFLAVFSSLFLILLLWRNYLVLCQGLYIILSRFLLFLVSRIGRIARSLGNRFLFACLYLLMLFSNFFDLGVVVVFLLFETRLFLEIVGNYGLVLEESIDIIEDRGYRFVDLKFGSCFLVSRICYFDLFEFFGNYLFEYKHEVLLHYVKIEKYHRY